MSALGLVSVEIIFPVLALLSPGFSLVEALFLLHFLHTSLMLCWKLPWKTDRLSSPLALGHHDNIDCNGWGLDIILPQGLDGDEEITIMIGAKSNTSLLFFASGALS